ncbi:MAG: GTPase Era, partial [Mycobacteriales bacterium]
IVHRPDAQLVLVDTPGLHRPRTLLGERLNDVVRATLNDVDVVAMCVPANEKVGPGDRFIAREIAGLRAPKVALLTKTDLAGPQQITEQLVALGQLLDWDEIIPVSAVTDHQVGLVADLLVKRLPESAPLYLEGEITDEPEVVMVAELIREAALEGVRDELPHSLAVVVDEMGPREGRDDLIDIHATVHVERSSQKGIVLGHQGERMKSVGTRARAGIEELLGKRVYLNLHVSVTKDWQRDPKQLQRLGF